MSVFNGAAARGFGAIRRIGAWMSISPDATYVATSIPGLGACKSTFCPAERREPRDTAPRTRSRVRTSAAAAVIAFAALFVAAGAAYGRLAHGRFVTGYGCDPADCQNRAGPVSQRPIAPAHAGDADPSALAGLPAVAGEAG